MSDQNHERNRLPYLSGRWPRLMAAATAAVLLFYRASEEPDVLFAAEQLYVVAVLATVFAVVLAEPPRHDQGGTIVYKLASFSALLGALSAVAFLLIDAVL